MISPPMFTLPKNNYRWNMGYFASTFRHALSDNVWLCHSLLGALKQTTQGKLNFVI